MNETLEKELLARKDKLKPILEGEISKRSLYEFLKLAAPVLQPSVKWSWNWHFEYVCKQLQEQTERMIRNEPKDRDLVISLPFRSGKSILINIIFPTWLWIKDPHITVISVSASEALATRFSHQSKILIESEWFQQRFKDIKLRPDSKSKLDFLNTKGGRRTAFGISSTVTGAGCDVFIIDDPQTPDQTSQTVLKQVLDTYRDTLYSRLNNPDTGFRILLQQRICEGDLTDELLKENPEGYQHICIPAKISKDIHPPDLIQYYDQQGLFWPDRFSQRVLDNFQNTLRPNAFSSQLMQRPTAEEGNIIKREHLEIIPIEILNDKQNIKWEIYMDTAYTKNKANDPSAIMICGKYQNTLYIRKVYERWLEFNDLINFVRKITLDFNVQIIHIEKVSSGILIFQELRRQLTTPILETKPGSKDKLTRIQSILPTLESQRVKLIKDNWNTEFIDQCTGFPFTKHDDMVDCLFYALDTFRSGNITTFY